MKNKINKFTILTLLLLSVNVIKGEENNTVIKPRAVVNISLANANVVGHNSWGKSADVRFYITQRQSIGINYTVFNKKTNNDYGFNLISPYVNFFYGGVSYQYDAIRTSFINLSPSVTIGYTDATLGSRNPEDKSLKTIVARNINPIIEPGLNLSFPIIKELNPQLGFTVSAKYRDLANGRNDFGEKNEFRGFGFSAGLSFVFY